MVVLNEVRNHIAFITLNRPAALNALSLEMILMLRALFEQHAADPDVYAVVLGGAGDRAFCAGGDIRALYHSFKSSGSLHHEFFAAEYPLDYLLYSYPKPYLVLMNGITLGGGMGIAQGSTLRVVGERTRMAMPEVAIGFFPDVGGSYFLSRIPGALGIYLALSGVQIGGDEARYSGLADVYLPRDALAALAGDLNAMIWGDDHRDDVRRFIRARATQSLPASNLSKLRASIDLHFSRPTVAAILASLESESHGDDAVWAQQTAKLMRSRSPTMLCVTLLQLQRGKNLNLAECFRMELGMAAHCFDHGDFLEGVRAVLIEKDNAPRWKPDRIEDVTDTMIGAFFRNRWIDAVHPLATLESQRLSATP
jgi:enoyl-CoA hydratase/carnithine racemase